MNNNNNKQNIEVPTRHNRLVDLYKAIQVPVNVLAFVSGSTLAVAILGFVMAKLGMMNHYYLIFGLVALLAAGLSFFWEATITTTWKEFTRQFVNWEFKGKYQRWLGFFVFLIPVLMAVISVRGSIFGGYDIAEVTAGEANTTDVTKLSSTLSTSNNKLDESYTAQLNTLRNEKAAALKAVKANHNSIIANNNTKAYIAKKEGNTKDYKWLSGGKKTELINNKNNAVQKETNKHDDLIAKLTNEKNSTIKSQNKQDSLVLASTVNANQIAVTEYSNKKSRHEIGFTRLAAFSSPLYLLLIFLGSLIEANIGAISEDDLITDEERTELKKKKVKIETILDTVIPNQINEPILTNTIQTDETNSHEQYKPQFQRMQTNNSNNSNNSNRAKIKHFAERQTVVEQPIQPKTNKTKVFDYSQTKSNLKVYCNRIKKDGYSDARFKGIQRYAGALIEAGYHVDLGLNKKQTETIIIVDDKDKPTLQDNEPYEITYDGQIQFFYPRLVKEFIVG